MFSIIFSGFFILFCFIMVCLPSLVFRLFRLLFLISTILEYLLVHLGACKVLHCIGTVLDNLHFTEGKITCNCLSVWLTGVKDLSPTGANTWDRRLQDLGIVGKEANMFCLLHTILTTGTLEMLVDIADPGCTKNVVLFLGPWTSSKVKG